MKSENSTNSGVKHYLKFCDRASKIMLNGLSVTKSEMVKILERNFNDMKFHKVSYHSQSEPGYETRLTYLTVETK